MLRFLLSILILWVIVWWIFSFLNPLNQLANRVSEAPDEYKKLLTEAIERNNPDVRNVQNIFVKWDSTDENLNEDTWKDTESNDTNERLWKSSFGNTEFYRSKNRTEVQNNRNFWERTHSINPTKTLSYNTPNLDLGDAVTGIQRDVDQLYNRRDGARGYFGTPPLPQPRSNIGNKQWGIIFDPPLVPPAIPSGWWEMRFGRFTQIRDVHQLRKL